MQLTPSQQQCLEARGNVIVIAGAGTGKTRTVVERAVRMLIDPALRLSLDQILMVTFTEAAAAEMRHRIRWRLEEEFVAQPGNTRLAEQLALLDTAQVSTVHGFCLKLIRQHFYELGLDPEVTVLSEEQSRLMASEVLDELFKAHYASELPDSAAVLDLLQTEARGWEVPVREQVMALHEFTQTRPDPEGWIAQQIAQFEQPEPVHWHAWLLDAFKEWRHLWLPVLRAQDEVPTTAHQCAAFLSSTLPEQEDPSQLHLFPGLSGKTAAKPQGRPKSQKALRSQMSKALGDILEADKDGWKGKKSLRAPLKNFFAQAEFLASLAETTAGRDPLAEDWNWARPRLLALLGLARDFAVRFSAAKRQAAALDFHDLEQFALRLLWDHSAGTATPLAGEWREKFRYIFVDEYQDINAAQDRILAALSRDGAEANRFLVGDLKQSIYRFRQADPTIFQDYAARWSSNNHGSTVYLSENFRSHESLLEFINRLFASLMRKEVGGVDYDEQARLRFGDPEGRRELRAPIAYTPGPADFTKPPELPDQRVELLLRVKQKEDWDHSEGEPAGSRWEEMSDTEREAHLIACRLRELMESKYQVWDGGRQSFRDVAWRDMVVLLRSPRGKVESYAKEFDRVGVPLQAKRTGFFESAEVADMVNLLRLLDNPLQDVPAIGVLRSPLAGLTVAELAQVRLAQRQGLFWLALKTWYRSECSRRAGSKSQPGEDGADRTLESESMFQKVHTFLDRYARWRTMSRYASLCQRLEAILSDTQYLEWLSTQPRGAQRQANIQQLLALARQCDESQRHNLYRFLTSIEAQQEAAGDREPAPLETENAVRLMSIHQSKGLEFPVVVVGDLGKRFNLRDQSSGVIIDEELGLCAPIKPPGSTRSYPSLPHWMARQRGKREAVGEELRLLYVALTRAQDKLILAGTTSETALKAWPSQGSNSPTDYQIICANNYLRWLATWMSWSAANPDWINQPCGRTATWSWRIHRDENPTGVSQPTIAPLPAGVPTPGPDTLEQLKGRMLWVYPFARATSEQAKTTVTGLRRRAAALDEDAAPARLVVPGRTPVDASRPGLTAAEIGTVHHRFLQTLSLEATSDAAALANEVLRLKASGVFTDEEAAVLDVQAVLRFWQSETGQRILKQSTCVERELPFTIRLGSEQLISFGLAIPSLDKIGTGDFIVAQGIVDLAVLLPKEIWVLDFKTDHIDAGQVASGHHASYETQIQLYGCALSAIYRRPVTSRWLHYLGSGETIVVHGITNANS